MLKGGAAKGGLPKPGLQERARLPPATSATGMKTSRSSNTLSTDLRLSRQLKVWEPWPSQVWEQQRQGHA
ncbi:hypothetical protein COCON_G00075180 [Conger conger]|uniref:Uncharacterized protein n=1 Tax=Conger conger TaxID=82655 RepID=A0A9Q1I1E3_CONCO|nr:hypothetical protein COCON_G00075180 [Conger conger]